MSVPLEQRLDELTPDQRELLQLFLQKERLNIASTTRYRAPGNPAEAALTRVWSMLLGFEPGVDDNYFELGGDSIGIIRMVSQARLEGVNLRTEWVFAYPTIAELASMSRLQVTLPVKPAERPAWRELAEVIRKADPEFARLLKQSGATPVDVYPLSQLQQGLLFHSLDRPSDGSYLAQWRFRITGPLDISRLKRAWERVVERHEAMRAAFLWIGLVEPMQVVLDRVAVEVIEEHCVDWRARAAELIEEERTTPFDLRKPPLLRIRFVRITDDEWWSVWTHHHLILDGWSQQILLKELFSAYREESLPPMRPGLFREHIYSQRAMDETKAVEFWRQQLNGYRSSTQPMGNKAGAAYTTTIRVVSQANHIRQVLKGKAVTLNALYQALWAFAVTLLAKKDDVVFGVASSGRSSGSPDIEHAVGLFINTLPFRIRFDPLQSLSELMAQVQKSQAQLIEYEWCGLRSIQSWIGWDLRSQLVESLYVYERFPIDLSLSEGREQFLIQDLETTTHEHYPFVFVVQDEDDSTILSLKHAGLDNLLAMRCERLLDFISLIPARWADTPNLSLKQLIGDWQGLEAEVGTAAER